MLIKDNDVKIIINELKRARKGVADGERQLCINILDRIIRGMEEDQLESEKYVVEEPEDQFDTVDEAIADLFGNEDVAVKRRTEFKLL